MTKKLFVGNLSYTTTNETLINFFSDFGNVQDVSIITNHANNKSKGFAFVNMETTAEAQSAIVNLNGSDLDGRNIIVSVAKSA